MFVEKEEYPLLDPKTLTPALNPILVVDGAGLDEVKKFLTEPREYVKDYETNISKTFYQRRARTLQLGNKDVQFIIDLLAFAEGSEDKLWAAQGAYRRVDGTLMNRRALDEEGHPGEIIDVLPLNTKTLQPVVDVIKPSFESDQWLKIGYNLEFEYVISKWNLGLRPWHYYDVFVAERLYYNGLIAATEKDFWGLKDAVRRHFKVEMSKEEQKGFNLRDPLTENQVIYTALDIRLPWVLKAFQAKRMEKARLLWALQIENDAIPAFGDLHLNGLWINPVKWQAIIDKNEIDLQKSFDELDSFFLPIVGPKELPDPDRVERARAEIKACDFPDEAEKEITARIKKTSKAKQPEAFAALKEERGRMIEARIARKAALKEAFKKISYLGTKKFADEVAKFRGQAKINYGAAEQVKAALKMYDPVTFTDRTLPDLDAKSTLLKFSDRAIINAFTNYKKTKKKLETYGYRWITDKTQIAQDTANKHGHVDPDTGRIHPPFRQLGTDTGRPSCSDPNVLNLPRPAEYRESFEARDGHNNCTKDCAGQELRILTEYTQELEWIKAFRNGEDLHSISTFMIIADEWNKGTIHTPTEMMVKNKSGVYEQALVPACAFFYSKDKKRRKCKCPKHNEIRDVFKAFNFGIVYDKSVRSFAIELNQSEDVVGPKLERWAQTFLRTMLTLKEMRETAYERGEARTLSGRRRILTKVSAKQIEKALMEKFPNGWNQRQKDRTTEALIAAVKREGGNMPIQGTGADLMKRAMGCGFDKDGKPYLWHILEPQYQALLENYVYDEFMVECPEQHCEAVGGPNGVGGEISDAIIRAGAEFVKIVPMESEGSIAKSWKK